jgi:hypothetical protein
LSLLEKERGRERETDEKPEMLPERDNLDDKVELALYT